MYSFEEVTWAIIREIHNSNSASDQLKLWQMYYFKSLYEDQTGEGFIYEMLAWFLRVNDYEHTDDFGGIVYKMGFSMDDFEESTRLLRGLRKVLQLHYPKKMEQMENRFLFPEMDDHASTQLWVDVMGVIAAVQGCPMEEVSDLDYIEVVDNNREILTLYKEISECATLVAIVNTEDDNQTDISYLVIRANDPNQHGAEFRYGDDGYDLFQCVIDRLKGIILDEKVAACMSMEEAKETARMLFDEDMKKEKTLRIPISFGTYAEAVYPFNDFRVSKPEGPDGELSGNQRFYLQRINEFFDGMSQESREFLRTSKF